MHLKENRTDTPVTPRKPVVLGVFHIKAHYDMPKRFASWD